MPAEPRYRRIIVEANAQGLCKCLSKPAWAHCEDLETLKLWKRNVKNLVEHGISRWHEVGEHLVQRVSAAPPEWRISGCGAECILLRESQARWVS